MNNKLSDMTLTPAEVHDLRQFVLDVLTVINYDDTGVSNDLIDGAAIASEILGIVKLKEEHQEE